VGEWGLIPFPDKTYDVIVVDPPWQIKKISRKVRQKQTSMDYSTMPIDEIKALPISRLSKKSTLVFMWTIQKYLFDAKDVLGSWGFNYLCMGVWEKTYGRSNGMPLYGFRWNAEFIAIGYKNKPELWPKKKLMPLCFQAENVRHSQKPDKFYEMVEGFGETRIDLFARQKRQGWDSWGDEIDGATS